jgi:hypothetical protein
MYTPSVFTQKEQTALKVDLGMTRRLFSTWEAGKGKASERARQQIVNLARP